MQVEIQKNVRMWLAIRVRLKRKEELYYVEWMVPAGEFLQARARVTFANSYLYFVFYICVCICIVFLFVFETLGRSGLTRSYVFVGAAQRWYRGIRVRKLIADYKRQLKSSTMIQRAYRAHRARTHALIRWKELADERE